MQLQITWYKKGVNREFTHGSVKHILSLEQIVRLIEANEIVVAIKEGQVVGYYLTNSLFMTENMQHRKPQIDILIAQDKMPDGNYVYQVQACIKPETLGLGLSKKMLSALKILVANRFEYLSAIISENNYDAIIKQHSKAL